jgi:hypothetical protein
VHLTTQTCAFFLPFGASDDAYFKDLGKNTIWATKDLGKGANNGS